MRENMKKIIFGIVIVIFCYGVIVNINHLISINKTYAYNFDSSVEIIGVKESYLLLNSYVENLKKLKDSTLGDEVVEAYTKSLVNINVNMSNFEFLSYTGNKELKQKDLYQMLDDYGKISYLDMLNVYKKLGEKYSSISSNEKQFTEHIYNMILTSNYIYETLTDNYSYSNITRHDSDFTVMTILSLFQEKLNTINYVNSLVIATGTISEEVEENTDNNTENNTTESGDINE